MNNGKHVVNHLFFRRKFDLVDDNELAVMLVTNVTNEFEAEAHQSILMGNDQTANFTTANSVYKSQKLRSLEIHATADGSVRISVSGEVIPGAAQRGCPLFFVMQYARPDAIARVV